MLTIHPEATKYLENVNKSPCMAKDPGLSGSAQSNDMVPESRDCPHPQLWYNVTMKEASERCNHLRGTQPNWPLLALKMEEGATCHGMKESSRSWKRQENKLSLRASREECSPDDTLFLAQ